MDAQEAMKVQTEEVSSESTSSILPDDHPSHTHDAEQEKNPEEAPDELQVRLEEFKKLDTAKVKPDEAIPTGVELAGELFLKLDDSEGAGASIQVAFLIALGMILNILKPLVKASDQKWSDWVQANVPYIGLRSTQDYMRIASIENCQAWSFMGKNRLVDIAPYIIGLNSKDPIGDLFGKNELTLEKVKALPRSELKDIWGDIIETAKFLKDWAGVEKRIKALEEKLEKTDTSLLLANKEILQAHAEFVQEKATNMLV